MNEAANEKAWTVIQKMVPLDVLLVGRGDDKAEAWYRIPSWRVEFNHEALKDLDVRLHKSLDGPSGWALSEATTGHKMYEGWDDEDEPGNSTDALVEFTELMLPKLTRGKMEAAMVKARAAMTTKPPCPFGEQRYVQRQAVSFDGQACAASMRAYFKTDAGRTSISLQPVSNPYLRNRIEAAFIAGWDAAAQKCEPRAPEAPRG